MRVEVEMFRTHGSMTYQFDVIGEVTPTSDASIQIEIKEVTVNFGGTKMPVFIDEETRHECLVELLHTYDEAKAGAAAYVAERYPHILEVA